HFSLSRCTIRCRRRVRTQEAFDHLQEWRSGGRPTVRAAGGDPAMRSSVPSLIALAIFLNIGLATIRAPEPLLKDKPKIHVPLHAVSQRELDHREALKLYGTAVLHERSNRLLEAVRAFEQAKNLEPEAAPVYKALCPLYLALDRIEEALAACRKTVELDPGDFESWY